MNIDNNAMGKALAAPVIIDTVASVDDNNAPDGVTRESNGKGALSLSTTLAVEDPPSAPAAVYPKMINSSAAESGTFLSQTSATAINALLKLGDETVIFSEDSQQNDQWDLNDNSSDSDGNSGTPCRRIRLRKVAASRGQ